MRKKIAVSLMTVGMLLVSMAAALLLYNNHENSAARKDSDTVMQSLKSVITQNEVNKSGSETDPFDTEMKTIEIDGRSYIGYLSIPALSLDLPVMADWDYPSLKISPCRYYGATTTHNLVIAAHNYRYHFGYLGNLKKDDIVIFTDADDKDYTYKVTMVETLLPTDVDKVKDTGDELILYTCTYGGAKRITVRCSLTVASSK